MEIVFDDVLAETDKARLLLFGDDEVWVPVSVMDDFDEESGTVFIKSWFVEKEGLEGYAL